MRPLSKFMLVLIALLFVNVQSFADACSKGCRFSDGAIKCKKGKAACGCTDVGTFEGTCGQPHGMQFSVNASSAQLDAFERTIENLKANHDLAIIVDAMRDILQATQKKDIATYISSTQKVKAAVEKLSNNDQKKLEDEIGSKYRSTACLSPQTDVTGGYCSDSDCTFLCATASREISRFSGIQPSSRLDGVMLKRLMLAPQPSVTNCKKLFAFALGMPLTWNRVAIEKNALTFMSKSDPELAMQLFVKVENPVPLDEVGFPEDVRAYAATEIFANYWKAVGVKGLPNIREVARHIGNTGEYPYRAMGFVINDLAHVRDEGGFPAITGIVNEAIGYYRRGSLFQNRNEEFFSLLQSTRQIVSIADYLQGLHLLVDNLLVNRISKGHFVAEIGIPKEFIRFTDMNRALLFRVFPLVAEADSGWAESLIMHYPELNKARSNIVYMAAAIVYGDAEPSIIVQLQTKMLEASLVENINKSQRNNSAGIPQMRQRLAALRFNISNQLSKSARNIKKDGRYGHQNETQSAAQWESGTAPRVALSPLP